MKWEGGAVGSHLKACQQKQLFSKRTHGLVVRTMSQQCRTTGCEVSCIWMREKKSVIIATAKYISHFFSCQCLSLNEQCLHFIQAACSLLNTMHMLWIMHDATTLVYACCKWKRGGVSGSIARGDAEEAMS